MLEVVKHQQEVLVPQPRGQAHHRRLVAGFPQTQRSGDRRGDQGRLGDRSKRHEPGAIREGRGRVGNDRQGEAGLAHSARTGQRHQRHVRSQEEFADGRRLLGAADEWAAWRRHGGGNAVRGLARRKLFCGSRSGELSHLRRAQAQGLGQHPHRLQPRSAADPPLQVADGAQAQPGPRGQHFLGEGRRHPIGAQRLAEREGCVRVHAAPPSRGPMTKRDPRTTMKVRPS